MKVEAKFHDYEQVEATITARLRINEWKEVRDAVRRGVDARFHGSASDFWVGLCSMIDRLENRLENDK